MNFMLAVGLRKRFFWIAVAIFFLIVTNLSCFEAGANVETFVGKAISSQGTLEYVEYHTVRYKNGKVSESQTIYYDANTDKIGELISEYSFGPQFGSYDFKDTRAQYQDGAKVSQDRVLLFRKKSPEDDMEEQFVLKERDQIVGQGFHQFIAQNLEQIAQGKVFHIRLVLPSRLDQYEFRIRKRKINGDTLYIRLEIDNWFLRLFAPHVEAEYDLKTRRLLRYEGISNLEDREGKHKKVIITYSYES